MKQRALALAVKRVVWANVALSATLAGTAFAQGAPAAGVAATVPSTAAAPDTASGVVATAPAAAAPAAAASDTAAAAPAAQNQVHQIKRFEVTGSLIRQADKTGFQSVQQISAKQIQESGQTSVGDFLRNISANSANSWGESTASSFAPGGSGIALRGLSEKYTLVLVDGKRVAPYAFAVNATDSFFDLNTLPLNVVDRIEVVKTGAVSQYGSDAIAGVVNIITKHDFQGLQLDSSLGGSTDGGAFTTKFSALGGFGSLASDGYNVTAAASYYKDTGFDLSQRSSTSNLDYSNQGPFGINNQLPSLWTANGVNSAGNCTNGSVTASANTIRGGAGTACVHDAANTYSGAPFTERFNAKVHADFKIDDNTTAYADVLASHNSTKVEGGDHVLRSGLIYDAANGSLIGQSISVPGSNPYNPTGTDATYYGILPGVVSSKTDAEYLSFSTGVKGNFSALNRDWDWATSYGHSQSIVTTKYDNSLTVAGLDKILAGGYNFDNPSSTPNALNGSLVQTSNIGVSKLDVLDATISTPKLFTLPTGDVGFGLGIQAEHQSESIEADGLTNSGQIFAPRLQTVEGSRNIGAAYYQFDIPLAGKYLSFSQSGRYDHYSDFGGVFSPRFALRSQPIDALTMYASYNRGFRAPEFLENSKSTSTGQMYVSYPEGSPSTLQYVEQTGNPNLQPEHTKNYNIGFELSPTRTTDIGFDFYKIHVDNVIGTSTNPTPGPTDANGNPYYFIDPYTNLGSMDTSGFEATLRQAFPTRHYGTFTFAADWAYVWHFYMTDQNGVRTDGAGNDLTLGQPFGGSFPRWKGNTSITWTSPSRKLDVVVAWEYTGPYSAPLQDPNASVASYSQFDLNFNYTGFKHWTIYGGINNIFNRMAPYDPLWTGSPVDVTGYDQSLYNNVGRYIQLGATYKF